MSSRRQYFNNRSEMPGLVSHAPPLSSPQPDDDDTDEFGRILLQHARDEQRLDAMLRKDTAAFRKGRAVPHLGWDSGVAKTPDNLGRASSSASSTSSEPLQQSVAAPDWGRRSKHSSGWLRRLYDKEQTAQIQVSPSLADIPRRPAFTGAAAKGISTVSDKIADRSPSPSRIRPLARRLSPRCASDPDQDITASSLLGSTPAMIPPKVVQSYNRQARRSRGPLEDNFALSRRIDRPVPNPSPDGTTQRQRHTLERNGPAQLSSSRTTGREHAVLERRMDSVHRQTNNDKENKPLNATSKDVESKDPALSTLPDGLRRRNRPGAYSSLQVTTQPSDSVLDQHDVSDRGLPSRQTSAHPPIELPEPISVSTPVMRPSKQDGKTPVVTGAWIDTPQAPPAKATESHSTDAIDPQDDSRQVSNAIRTEPNAAVGNIKASQKQPRPASGLDDLVRKIRASDKPTQSMGDDTIASLEGMIDPSVLDDHTASQTLDVATIQAELERLHDQGRPLSEADKGRKTELMAIQGMDKHLNQARISIKDAKNGLKRVERRVDESSQHDCSACGRPGSTFAALGHEVERLFVTRRPNARGGLRRWTLTWLSLFLITAMSWYIVENSLCSVYCQPRYAGRMRGYGVDPDAPRYPHVTPTILFGPFRWLWQPVLSILVWCIGLCWTVLASLFGLQGQASNVALRTQPSPGSAMAYLYGGRVPIVEGSSYTRGFDVGAGSDLNMETLAGSSSAMPQRGPTKQKKKEKSSWFQFLASSSHDEDDEPLAEGLRMGRETESRTSEEEWDHEFEVGMGDDAYE